MAERATIARGPGSHPRMTYEEFLEWNGAQCMAEWVDGEVMEFMPASEVHQALVVFLVCVLNIYVLRHRLGRVYVAPFQMKTGPTLPGREPDILFVRTENLRRITTKYLNGPADLAVEIVSEDSQRRDRQEKLREYEAGGVQEYWVIDPERQAAVFYHLDGTYQEIPIDGEGVMHSQVLEGFRMNVNRLWESPLPSPLEMLAEARALE